MGKTYTVESISKKRNINFGKQDRYYIKNHHEPLISRELLNKAQEIRENQLVDLLLEQKINKDIYNQKYAKISEGIEIAEGELQAYNENNEFGEDFRSRLLSFKRIFENKKTIEIFDGEIFRTLIKEAYIGETDEAGEPLPNTINFVFKTGLKINISPLFPNPTRGRPRRWRGQ